MSEFSNVLMHVEGGVATVTLNRPEKRNALDADGYERLARLLEQCGNDESVRVVVISGRGKAFCSGGDLGMATTVLSDAAQLRIHFFRRMMRVSRAMIEMPKPVICRVNGAAVGGGAELICFADLAVGSTDASFLFDGTRIGGSSFWGAPQLLPMMVGLRRAEEILLLSEWMTAEDAFRLGFLNRVVPPNELDSTVASLCARIAQRSPEGLRLTKSSIRPLKERLLVTMASDAEVNAMQMASEVAQNHFSGTLSGMKEFE